MIEERRDVLKSITCSILLAALLAGPAWAAPDPYGGVSLSGIYAEDEPRGEDEELDGSALVARGFVGVRLDPDRNTTRLQASSSYYGYLDRKDRWSNAAEAEQQLRLGQDFALSIEGSGATNLLTLERRSTDQAGIATRLRFEPGDHRLTVGAGSRRRWYDGSNARSWAPFAEVEYRYRLGSWHAIEIEARTERINSTLDTLDYSRNAFSAYYLRPLGRNTRVRFGLTHRRWTWDQRFAPDGERRRERLWLPQIRLTQELGRDLDLELDARRVIRRSNDDRLEREGSRVAATLRKTF